jgi:ankyrin repeat protein
LLAAAAAAVDAVFLRRLLLRAGAGLQTSEVRQAALLCSAVSEGDLQLLKRLLAAGANPNAGDYDKRRPLHIAAADGNLPAVSRCGLPGADGLHSMF